MFRAVVQRCSVKKVFLEISQNSQENTCARVSFLIKFQASGKKEGLMQKLEAYIDCEEGAQINILANKIVTWWCPKVITNESKQTIHYIYFIFSRYVPIKLQIWSKNWNSV